MHCVKSIKKYSQSSAKQKFIYSRLESFKDPFGVLRIVFIYIKIKNAKMYGLMPPVDSNVKIHEKTEDNIMTLFGNLGQTLNIAVERFVAIGEIIAEENTDIKIDMYEAAKDARKTGKSIERLCELFPMTGTSPTHHIEPLKDYSAVILAARSLLSSVTRILLLVDIVIVKKLLTAKKRATECLEKLESVMNFTEFVRAFSVFGMEITELAYLTGYHHNSFKEERRRAQMFSARQILEKSISILLTSSKNSLIHCDCNIVKENRDTVFCQIRRAMDLIHFVVKDSIFYCSNPSSVTKIGCNQSYENESIYSSIKYITCLIENFRTRFSLNEETKEGNNNVNISQNEFDNSTWSRENYLENKNIVPFANSYMVTNRKYNKYSGFYDAEFRMELTMAFEQLFEKTHDFTDSPYIKHEHRQTILTQCAKIKLELNVYNSILNKNDLNNVDINVKTNKLEDGILKALEELCKQLVISVSSEMLEFNESIKICTKLVNSFHILATSHDLDNLNQRSNKFHDYCDHIFDICKLLQHIAPTENLQVQAKCLAINMRIYGPQVFTAAKILWKYSNSTAALDNFEAFSEMFKWLTNEILLVAKKIFVWIDTSKMQRPQFENCENTSMLTKPYSTSAEEKDIEQYRGLDDKNLTDESNAYQNKYEEDMTDNDILKRAKNMSAMAFLMYQFTKGNGSLRTTQDLFTQAEYFAEEANRLYKVLRHFSYQVPASDNKKDLLGILDRVPTFVQALQFTVKDHTVGKAATFVKVDHVIRETKNLMNVINKVVSKCFECAHKYKLNFTGITSGMNSGSVRGDENLAGGMGDSKGTTSSSEGSM